MKQRERAVFDDWKQEDIYKDKSQFFVTDGVFCEDEFKIQKPRIVFVLKEAVGEAGVLGFDLCKFVSKEQFSTTWNNITRWTTALLAIHTGTQTAWKDIDDITADDRAAALKKIAAVNLKKTYGGPSSDMNEIADYASSKIWDQLAIYEPDMIVACGSRVADILYNVSDLKDRKIDWKLTQRGLYHWDGGATKYLSKPTPIIDFYHPQSRIRSAFMTYALVDAWSELKPQ